jgi:hypothetical protein
MTVSRRTKRPRHAKRRLDLSGLKQALKDDRVFPCLGLVTDEDVDSHFDLDGDDLLVEVALVPGEERVSARLGFGAGPSAGSWFIPAVGSEVALMICDGDLEAGVFIVGILSSGAVPDGVAPGVMVIASPSKVLIHDGAGGAAPVATKADIDALQSAIDSHIHPTTAVTGGGGPVGVIGPPTSPMPTAAGTQTLEAK